MPNRGSLSSRLLGTFAATLPTACRTRRRIADEDTGAETRKTQERVVKELEDLLILVRNSRMRPAAFAAEPEPKPGSEPEAAAILTCGETEGAKRPAEFRRRRNRARNSKGDANERRQDGPADDAEGAAPTRPVLPRRRARARACGRPSKTWGTCRRTSAKPC